MIEQRTPEWFAERLGKITASRIADVVGKTKSGSYGAARKNYMAELLCQRLTGQQEEKFTSAAMQHGTDTEPAARAMYMLETGTDGTETGFIPQPSLVMRGASPDGLVGEDGLIEIKCPNTATHLEFLQNRKPKHEYLLQMQWQMACTGRQWCDFVSYDDRLPEKLAYRCIRIPRDNKLIADLEEEAVKFLTELDETVRQLEEQAA